MESHDTVKFIFMICSQATSIVHNIELLKIVKMIVYTFFMASALPIFSSQLYPEFLYTVLLVLNQCTTINDYYIIITTQV